MFTIRSSLLKQAVLNPKLCRAMIKGYDIPKTSSMGRGTAAHHAILEPNKFAEFYRIKEPRKGKEFDIVDDKTLVLQGTHDELIGMQEEFYSDKKLANMVKNASIIEGELFHVEQNYNLVARPDLVYKDILIDYKTTSGIKKNWLYTAMDSGYDIQFAHYQRVLKHHGITINKWYHITQSTTFPYNIRVFKYDQAFRNKAEISWENAFECFDLIYNNKYKFVTDEATVSFNKGDITELPEEAMNVLDNYIKNMAI